MQHDKSSTKTGHPRDQLLLLAHHTTKYMCHWSSSILVLVFTTTFRSVVHILLKFKARTWRATRSFSARSSVSLRSAALWSSMTFFSSLSARQKCI
jgi:hypothetical protein